MNHYGKSKMEVDVIANRDMTITEERRSVTLDLLSMWGSFFFTQLLSLLLAVYIRAKLGPELMGVWALLQVFIGYSGYANLGIYDAALREIPYARGRGENHRVHAIKSVSFSFSLALELPVFSPSFFQNILFKNT